MRALSAALVTCLLPLAAAADPQEIISSELSMDPAIFGPAPKDQTSADVAHDGKGAYLVVWTDSRRASSADVYAARVDSAGKVLDRGGILVSSHGGAQGPPAVTHDGARYFVVWHGDKGDKYGAHVSAAGKVTSAGALTPTVKGTAATDVAFSRDRHLVVWQERDGNYTIKGALLDAAGKMKQAPFSIHSGPRQRRNPRVTGGPGGAFLVVWQDYRTGKEYHIHGALVTGSGAVTTLPISTTDDGNHLPAVAFDGTRYLVVWHTNSDIRGARVSAGGTLLDKQGVDICVNKNIRMAPDVTHGGKGGHFVVVWKDYRDGAEADVYAARVTGAGKTLDPAGVIVSKAAELQEAPRVAGGAKGFLVAWEDYRSAAADADIYGARFSAAGKTLDPAGVLISAAANHQAAPAVTHDGGGYMVVWQDRRNGAAPTYRPDVYGAWLSSTGKAQGARGLAVTPSSAQLEPAVASDGKARLVALRQVSKGLESLLTVQAKSSVTIEKPVAVFGGQAQNLSPALAWGKAVFMLAWYTPTLGTVKLLRLDGTGQPLAAPATLGTGQSPAMATDGGRFLVVWSVEDHCPGAVVGTSCVLGVVVGPDGKLLGAGKPVSLASTANRRYEDAAVAFDGARFLAVWADNSAGSSTHDTNTDIRGVLVSAAGVPEPQPFSICAAKGAQRQPAVVHDGTRFVVVWTDQRHDDQQDLYGGAVEVTGGKATVPKAGGFAISRATTRELDPALASDGAGHSLVVYARFDSSPAAGSQRVLGRLLSWGKLANGFPCASDAQCTSGHCVDGVCCDGPCGGGSLTDCQACSVARGAAKDGVCHKWPCPDAGAPDAKVPSDAGVPDAAAPQVSQKGCSCEAAAAPGASGIGLMLLALWWTRRRASCG